MQCDNISIRNAYIIQQRQHNDAFFNKLLTNECVSLLLQHRMNDMKCIFTMQSSILKYYLRQSYQHNSFCDDFETWIRISNILSKELIEDHPTIKKFIEDLYRNIQTYH